jgi:hypothetical protein
LPIVASRGGDVRRLLRDLRDEKRRAGAIIRLRALGARVVPHVPDELEGLNVDARRALLDALQEVHTADAKTLRRRLVGAEPPATPERGAAVEPAGSTEAGALDALRALPPPRPKERASISRERGEAHLVLARTGSRLARRELLLSLEILGADRARLYCEAAGLIGDAQFLAPLARIAHSQSEAVAAISRIARRERITSRSSILRALEEPLRLVVARSISGH